MITRAEARDNIENKIPKYQYEVKVLVNDIYDSIGTCGECKNATKRHTPYYCSLIDITVPRNWYCAGFERKVDDNYSAEH